jgi:hypothetical protein
MILTHFDTTNQFSIHDIKIERTIYFFSPSPTSLLLSKENNVHIGNLCIRSQVLVSTILCLPLGLFTLERNTKGKWSALKENPKSKDVLHANT